MTEFSPREIVSELDRFIVGHPEAKKAVAVALREEGFRPREIVQRLMDEHGASRNLAYRLAHDT